MTVKLFVAFACLFLLPFLIACKKKNDNNNPCGSYGGVVSSNTCLFWIDHDFACGSITVEVKDAEGKIVPAYQDKISYTAASTPTCNNVNYGKYATFDLYQGKNYTYKASCSGKSWTGTISVPCEQNQCKSVLLQ